MLYTFDFKQSLSKIEGNYRIISMMMMLISMSLKNGYRAK